MEIAFLLAAIASVLAIVDPIGTLPFFTALTEGFSASDREVVVQRSIGVAGAVLAVFALFGRFLFAAFGFTLQAFEIAGGVLLFMVAYDMLRGEITRTKLTPADREEALARRDEIAVVPLGIPLLAGPGAISTVMIFEGNAGNDLLSVLATFIAIAITVAVTYIVLHYGPAIVRSIGRIGVMAITRVLGLLLAAVAVQFIANGVLGLLPHP